MKRDRMFDDVLNECIEKVLKGEPIEACLAAHPEHAAELSPLLQTALNTRRAAAITPRPEFRQQAFYRFQTAFRDLPAPRRVSLRWQVRLVTVLSVIVVILMAGTGTVAVAGGSLPDETLYPVKLATEEVRLALTLSAIGKAELYTEFADRRITEIVRMADEGKVEQVEKVTERMNDQLIAMAKLPLPSGEAASGGQDKPQALMAAPTADTQVAAPATGVVPPATARAPVTIPASPGDKAQPAPSANISAPVAAARQGTGPVPAPLVANATALKTTVVEKAEKVEKIKAAADLRIEVSKRAIRNTEDLKEVLKRVPDNVKPALEKAIETAGKGYEEALKNIGRKEKE